jgi:hypothetical protein
MASETDPDKRRQAIIDYVNNTKDVTLQAAILKGLTDMIIGPEAEIVKMAAGNAFTREMRNTILSKMPKVVGMETLGEGATGAIQEITNMAAERALGELKGDLLTWDNVKRVINSAADEALGGLGISTGVETVRAVRAPKEPTALDTAATELTERTRRENVVAELEKMFSQKILQGFLDEYSAKDPATLTPDEKQSLQKLQDWEATKNSREAKTTGAEPPQLRSLENLTEGEVSEIQRGLYAELGRPANEQELRKAFDDYIVEQNAGNTTESGTDRTSVSGVSFGFEDARVPDTGTATTSTSGGLDGTSEATTVSGTTEKNEPITLEEQGDAAYDTLLQAQQLQVLQRLQLLGIQIHPSDLSCATGMVPSGQNMLLVAVSNLPINQWPKTT